MPIEDRDDLLKYLALDLEAQGIAKWHGWYRYTKPVPTFQRRLRRAEYWTNTQDRAWWRALAALVARYRAHRSGVRLGLYVPLNTFGPGLSIAHPGMLVVNPSARIGQNCRIHQGVTIGEGPDGVPTLGRNCWIGPNAVIFGGITIGEDVAIGANSVVTQSLPSHITAVGAPATITKSGGYPGHARASHA